MARSSKGTLIRLQVDLTEEEDRQLDALSEQGAISRREIIRRAIRLLKWQSTLPPGAKILVEHEGGSHEVQFLF